MTSIDSLSLDKTAWYVKGKKSFSASIYTHAHVIRTSAAPLKLLPYCSSILVDLFTSSSTWLAGSSAPLIASPISGAPNTSRKSYRRSLLTARQANCSPTWSTPPASHHPPLTTAQLPPPTSATAPLPTTPTLMSAYCQTTSQTTPPALP